MRIWMLILLALLAIAGLKETLPSAPLLQEPQASPAVLRVCWGCPYYSSIQAALDAARPGDIIEVEPAPVMLGFPLKYSLPYYISISIFQDGIVISKPITLRAKSSEYEDPLVLPKVYITAESGQVLIEGFVFENADLSWYSGADLILRRNRFIDTNPYTTLEVSLGGKGQAQLIDNDIIDSFVSVFEAAHVLLTSNRFLRSDIDLRSSSRVILEHNVIEGAGVEILGPGDYSLEGNVLIGSVRLDQRENLIGVEVYLAAQADPIIVTANRNIIARYEKGIAIGGSLCEVGQEEWLQLSGQGNVIEQNDQDLCPSDYPWPPGFRKWTSGT